METYFAPAERADDDELNLEIDAMVRSQVVKELLHSVNGVVAILDHHRQVVAVNDALLRMIGIQDPESVLGLRPGAVLGCVHAAEQPNGCGTTKYCSTCGAAVAIVATLGSEQSTERICALTARRDDAPVDCALLVHAHPLRIEGKKFVLLLLQDITLQELRAALERTFFHDVGNMLTGLLGASTYLVNDEGSASPHLAEVVHQCALRLNNEIEIQKCLFANDISEYRITKREVAPEQFMEDLRNVFARHKAAEKKQMQCCTPPAGGCVTTDLSLALRVMCNMITNAFEATDEGGTVKVWFDRERDRLTFNVWNSKAIPPDVQYRIFQRSFSTKEESGRGLGTYSMRLLGEKLLGGKVSFSSSESEGTTFRFSLPL